MDNFRRNLLVSSSGGGGTDPSQAAPLEVAFYNGSNIVIRKQEDWVDGETPIGIVVVPGYHNRYGDGSCGIMSLVGMDNYHPETGIPITSLPNQTDNIKLYWGLYNTSIGNNIFISNTSLTSSADYIPYQTSSASTACSADNGALVWPYAGTLTEPTSGASTEYSNDGGYVTATSGKAGCDFNGIRNTVALYVKTSNNTQWTSSGVANNTSNTPAVACAGRFKTIGTKSFLDVFSGTTSNDLSYGTSASTKTNKGFWYLPAEGELCYLPSKRFEINKTILALNQKYGNVGIMLNVDDTSSTYWSSSERSNIRILFMDMKVGNVNVGYKDRYSFVRAFMRL